MDRVNQLNYCKVSRVNFTCSAADGASTPVFKVVDTMEFELEKLTPFTPYSCTASIENHILAIGESKDFSRESPELEVKTKEGRELHKLTDAFGIL